VSGDLIKFNPAFKSDEEIVAEFAVRHHDLSAILDTIRQNISAPSNQHMLVIGPRGTGKTTLVLRAVVEVRTRDPELGSAWYPIVFSEESYPVSTPGEFWLEALFHVAEQRDDDACRAAYEDLRDERDETRLRERALARLMDLADREGKRLLLVVENLQMLLGDQLSEDDAWVLRETLQNESRIMLLGTATTRFWEMECVSKAFYEMFRVLDLKPLNTSECRRLWEGVSGQEVSEQRVRPIEILTGGNPRLLAVIATFAARSSLRELMGDLTRLVDDHTDYFKSHLDELPPMERKVFVALCDLWDPATAREVGRVARTDTNKASAQLMRLIRRGAVVADQEGRKKTYRVAERLYNIYYLMRRRGTPDARVRALVRFMISFYEPGELLQVAAVVAREAAWLAGEAGADHLVWAKELMGSVEESLRRALGDAMMASIKDEIRMGVLEAENAFKVALETRTPKSLVEAETNLRKLMKSSPHVPELALLLAHLFAELGSDDQRREAVALYDDVASQAPTLGAWSFLLRLAVALQLGKHDEALLDCQKLLDAQPPKSLKWPDYQQDLESLYRTLVLRLSDPAQAAAFAEDYLRRTGRSADSLNNAAWAAHLRWGQPYADQAEAWAREAHEKEVSNGAIAHTLATILASRGEWSEALDLVPTMLADATNLEKCKSEYTDLLVDSAAAGHTGKLVKLLVDSAAAGHTGKLVKLLEDSPAATALEPLICALRLDLGQKVSVAPEIMEVAKDVLAEIRTGRDKLTKQSDEPKQE